MTRTSCGGCGDADLHLVLDLGSSPLANTPEPAGTVAQRHPLRVVVCSACQLLQLLDVVPDSEIFTDTYTFYTSTSPTLVEYNRTLAAWLLTRWPDQAHDSVIDVGSNDGDLLRHFKGVARLILGVDPAGGPAAAAAKRGVPTDVSPFSIKYATNALDLRGPATLITAKNVAAHVELLDELFSGMARLLSRNGIIVIEVQYLVDMLLNGQIDQVYHEHRYFWSVTTLHRTAQRYGLHVIDVLHTEPQGGSIRVSLSRVDGPQQPTSDVSRFLDSERWLQGPDAYADMQRRANYTRDKLRALLETERHWRRTVAGYGAPAKATTLANFCELTSEHVAFITDTTPAKQGTKLPGTDIPIVHPASMPEPDTYLLFAHNYLSSIIRRERAFLQRGGRFIVPLPTPYII